MDWSSQNITTYGQRMSAFVNTNLNFVGSLLSRQVDGAQLQYLRNRYYDPSSGRFTQEDPIGLAGGLNLYGFANGDPVNFSDPFGLCPPPFTGLCARAVAWFLGRAAPAMTTVAAEALGVGAASRLVPGGGLAAHEGALRGHTIARHVGQSVGQLRDRLSQQPGISAASSFFDRADAENAVAGAIEANAGRIGDWLRGDLPTLAIRANGAQAAGLVLERGAQESVASSRVAAVLVRDAASELGYYIKTAYPEK